jgi:uncharacterized protein YggU (UPF0235/DUF167 family)
MSGVRITVRVRPGSRVDTVGGSWPGPRGPALLVSVRARAVEGLANEAVLTLVATAFGLRRRAVALHSGERGRDKVLDLTGDDAVLAARLAELLAAAAARTD